MLGWGGGEEGKVDEGGKGGGLFEGKGGEICYYLGLLAPERSCFPGFEL